jgi:hypothetical protein
MALRFLSSLQGVPSNVDGLRKGQCASFIDLFLL